MVSEAILEHLIFLGGHTPNPPSCCVVVVMCPPNLMCLPPSLANQGVVAYVSEQVDQCVSINLPVCIVLLYVCHGGSLTPLHRL